MDSQTYNVEKYSDSYSEDGLWNKISGNLKKVGAGLIYEVLQLFYVTQNPNVPMKIRAAIDRTVIAMAIALKRENWKDWARLLFKALRRGSLKECKLAPNAETAGSRERQH